jgi:DNA mismatch repair ATPase MutL
MLFSIDAIEKLKLYNQKNNSKYFEFDYFGIFVGILSGQSIITQTDKNMYIIDYKLAYKYIIKKQIHDSLTSGNFKKQKLLIPLELEVDEIFFKNIVYYINYFQAIGIDIEIFDLNSIIITSVPLISEKYKLHLLIDLVVKNITSFSDILTFEDLIYEVANFISDQLSYRNKNNISIDQMKYIVTKLNLYAKIDITNIVLRKIFYEVPIDQLLV